MDRTEAYGILEIAEGASFEEARIAYRRLCIVWHPDRFLNDELRAHAEEKLKRINEAFATINESSSTDETSAEVDPNLVYQDLHCRYLGGDARLWKLGTLELKGRHCAVQIAPDGLLLVTFRDGQVDQFATYSLDTFIKLYAPGAPSYLPYSPGSQWIRPTDKSRWFIRYSYGTSPDAVEINVKDPEGILKHTMMIKVTFRSDYYAQLFAKRMREAWGLIEPGPKPTPKPKPTNPDESGEGQGASVALFLCGVLIITIILLALAANG